MKVAVCISHLDSILSNRVTRNFPGQFPLPARKRDCKNGDSWRIYDKKKKITDVGNMQLGNLIKDAGDYYFVTKVATHKTPTQTLSARTGENGDPMNQLLPLMLFKNKLGGDDDTMKLLLIFSIMGGNMAGSNTPLMSYLIFDTFIDKKNEYVPQTGNGAAK